MVCTIMTLPSTATVRSVTVPGARLHYEVRGTGPLLLVIGSPMASAEFAPLADALASDHTVVTYDPRGFANSTIDDPEEDSTPELRADDVAAILDDLGAESADVFGSSGGAVTGLALVVRHPGRVRTLIAHEPPLLELLPDAAQQRANTQDIIDSYRTDGMQVAWFKFMANAGFDMSAPEGADRPKPPEPSEDQRREAAAVLQPRTVAHHFLHSGRRGTEGQPDKGSGGPRSGLRASAHPSDVYYALPIYSATRPSNSPATMVDSWKHQPNSPTRCATVLS